LNVEGFYRRVLDHHDGISSFQLLCCKGFVAVDYHELDDWNFCPHCGHEIIGQLECRQRRYPRWAWDRGLEPQYPKHDDPKFWEIQSRNIRPPDNDLKSDLFDWTPDFNAAWIVRTDNMVRELRHLIAEEEADGGGMFWDKEYRLVWRDKNEIYQIYQRDWMVRANTPDQETD
jgi:hypothetical protein